MATIQLKDMLKLVRIFSIIKMEEKFKKVCSGPFQISITESKKR